MTSFMLVLYDIYFECITSYQKFLNRILLLFDKNISAPAKRKPNAKLKKQHQKIAES